MTPQHRFASILIALGLMLGYVSAEAGKHALLIGVSDYADTGLRDLPGARQDVVLVRRALERRFGLRPDQISTLVDEEATHTGIQAAFAKLAEAVEPGDFVYVHYSGHGSLVKDYNDDRDDPESGAWDQTLVGHGARRPGVQGLDRYDILDDEINRWLAPIAERAGELVFVTDACHSATNTRGADAPVARAVPPADQSDHPYARLPGRRDPLAGAILIGAADDSSQANEAEMPDGARAGLFTWYWASALEQARAEDTWRQVFERARVSTQLEDSSQVAQLTGTAADRCLLGGRLDARRAIVVATVWPGGRQVKLDGGLLDGVTKGSLYATTDAEDTVRVRIVSADATSSDGRVEPPGASLEAGESLYEIEHVYETASVALYALAPDDADRRLWDLVRERIGQLPGFAWTDSQSAADLVLAVLRPHRLDGEAQYSATPRGRNTLPDETPEADLEVWVLTPGEQLLHPSMAVPLRPLEDGLARLTQNLERYRGMIELRRLTQVGSHLDDDMLLELIRFDACAPDTPDCITLADGSRHREVKQTRPIDELSGAAWPQGSLISFAIENRSHRPRYVYVFEFGHDWAIDQVYPAPGSCQDCARVDAGTRLAMSDRGRGVYLAEPGPMSIWVLATQQPIRPRLLTQPGFVECDLRQASDPLEQLLAGAMEGVPTRSHTPPGTWCNTLIDFEVVDASRQDPPRGG